MQTNTRLEPEDDQSVVLPIGKFFSVVRANFLTIAITVLLVGGAACTWEVLHPSYKSQGLFAFGSSIPVPMPVLTKGKDNEKEKEKESIPGITWPNYKRFSAAFMTNERFSEFVESKKLAGNPDIASLAALFASRNSIASVVEPVYAFSKLDAKELMAQPKDGSNNVVGLKIDYVSDTPEAAQRMVDLLGHYVMDSIIYFVLSDQIRAKTAELKTNIIKLDNLIIGNKEQLDESRRRAEGLKRIIARNPRVTTDGPHQVVAITETTARFLPPSTLLMTAEVEAADADETIFRAKHRQKQNALQLEYYDRANLLLDSTKSGEALLRGLEAVKTEVFKNKDVEADLVKEVYNLITLENQTATTAYLDRSRFIAGPTLSRQTVGRPVFKLGSGLVLGLLLSLLIVFGRQWWLENQTRA